ncbi:hypothetical protein PCASD_18140 [Puccinia coronata f. sp. avenae]|uniref:Uncharacterized protein n=1 Tax=Puccinia coronata f. sp. avenae TaxID=200324 RepID=A0A2N5SVB2_9BASI|nr:hypothetical protein PCASD_18140 [Puccinia coronata f. sp. avenae]
MAHELPSNFESFKTNISMNFESETFEKVLKKLEYFAAQNQLNDYQKNNTPVQAMFTCANDSDIKHPNKQHTTLASASSPKQHSSHLTQYTEEDKETLGYL